MAGSGPPTVVRRGAREGLLAAAAALAVYWAAARAYPQLGFAPFALADRVVRVTPGGVATWFIDHLHHNAQRLLATSATLVFVVAGVALGLLARRLPTGGVVIGGALFGALCLGAALANPVPAGAAAPAVAAADGALFGVLLWLAGRPARTMPAPDLERRRALIWIGSSAAAVIGGAFLGPLVAPRPRVTLLGDLARRLRAAQAATLRGIPGLSPAVTSVADHYVVDIDIDDPIVDAASWRLKVEGDVGTPMSLGFDELQRRFPLVQEYAVLSCVSNPVGGPLVGNSLWEGVRLRELLAAAGPAPGATEAIFRCVDGYSVGVPLERAMHPSALVAIAQDGQPLARAHGFPCRIRIPALYGMMNAKWVSSIELAATPYLGYWAKQGWSASGVVRTQSRIDTPHSSARLAEPTWIAGVAWAGLRGIRLVEVSTDGGRSWLKALLEPPLSPYAWRRWALRWTPQTRGRTELVCRATDGTGTLQDPRPRPPHPSGASGYHRVAVTIS
jgi:DMSO/TMAO reductase YedYZ molybdopterin-dependent catalytic subunit